ncbi:MAG: imelysin family protein [Alphaproteobacteria bacterium]
MTARWGLGLIVAASLAAAPAAGTVLDEALYRQLNQDLVERHVLPRYHAFAAATAELPAATTVCAEAPEALLPAYHTAMDAWMAVALVGIGPVDLDMRGPRIHYWPDRRNTGGRQFDQLMDERPRGLTAESLAVGSVALQGLPALERVLFDQPDDGLDDFECGLAAAIAENLAGLGHELAREWMADRGEARMIATAGDPDSYFPSARDVSADQYQALYEFLQILAQDKLAAPLGASLADARPRRAESWRSGRSARNIAINLRAVLDQFSAGDGFGYEDALVESGGGALAAAIRNALEQAIAIADALPLDLPDAVADPALRPEVERLYALVDSAREHVGARMGAALGLSMGFNSLDGD